MATYAKLERVLQQLVLDLKLHYKARFGSLILLEIKQENMLELLLILEGEVNQVREILRVEPNALRASREAGVEISVLPVAREIFDAALEPELWEVRFTGRVVESG